jgi:uncharacterized membrane protein YcjF (UPF0283 family)
MPRQDENIRRILGRAAQDEAFRNSLFSDRASALEKEDLSENERLMLLAASDEQLRKMIDAIKDKPWYERNLAIGGAGKLLIGAAAVAAAAAIFTPATLGHSREAAYEAHALSSLKQIYLVENQYREEYGVYAPESVLRTKDEVRQILEQHQRPHGYEIIIESSDETFAVTARHKTRADTRPMLRIGPDGEVRILPSPRQD